MAVTLTAVPDAEPAPDSRAGGRPRRAKTRRAAPGEAPPRHLSASSRRWWLAIAQAYELGPEHFRLLTQAAQAWDRAEEARLLLKRDGLVVEGRGGRKYAHPAVGIERDSRLAFARLTRELALTDEPPLDARPPHLRGRGR